MNIKNGREMPFPVVFSQKMPLFFEKSIGFFKPLCYTKNVYLSLTLGERRKNAWKF